MTTLQKPPKSEVVPESDKPVANSLVVLREEFDDWAVLFDPDTGSGFGINPMVHSRYP